MARPTPPMGEAIPPSITDQRGYFNQSTPQKPEPHLPRSHPWPPVWQLGRAPCALFTCAANRLSFFTTRALSQEGHAMVVSDRTRSSNELRHSLHSYSKIGIVYSRRPSRSLRQITLMRLYRPSPSLTVSMSP